MKNNDQDMELGLPLNFDTPLTAKNEAAEEDMPSMEQVEVEREKQQMETNKSVAESEMLRAAVAVEREIAASPYNKINNPNILLPNHDKAPLIMPEGINTGEYLKKIREEAGLNLRQVEESTRIALSYLESLERNDMSKMPPPVYIIAYIRKLCNFYNISEISTEKMSSDLRHQLPNEVPDSIINQVEIDEESIEENEREVKRICWIIFGSVSGFILLAVLLGLLLWARNREDTPPSESENGKTAGQITNTELIELLPAPILEIPELPAQTR